MALVVGAILMALAMPCFFVSDLDRFGFFAIGASVLAAALFLLRSIMTPKPFLEILRTSPSSIVWIYQQRGNQSGVAIVIGLENGRRELFPVATPFREQLRLRPKHGDSAREKALVRALQALAPRATVGFSPDFEKRFLASPTSLRAPG